METILSLTSRNNGHEPAKTAALALRNGDLVGPFVDTLDCLPARGLIRTIESQCRMLEKDLSWNRLAFTESVASLLMFHRFLNSLVRGVTVSTRVVPEAHFDVYRRTVARLTEAGQLPAHAPEAFESAFSPSSTGRERA